MVWYRNDKAAVAEALRREVCKNQFICHSRTIFVASYSLRKLPVCATIISGDLQDKSSYLEDLAAKKAPPKKPIFRPNKEKERRD